MMKAIAVIDTSFIKFINNRNLTKVFIVSARYLKAKMKLRFHKIHNHSTGILKFKFKVQHIRKTIDLGLWFRFRSTVPDSISFV